MSHGGILVICHITLIYHSSYNPQLSFGLLRLLAFLKTETAVKEKTDFQIKENTTGQLMVNPIVQTVYKSVKNNGISRWNLKWIKVTFP